MMMIMLWCIPYQSVLDVDAESGGEEELDRKKRENVVEEEGIVIRYLR